jgi:hypothetical protein
MYASRKYLSASVNNLMGSLLQVFMDWFKHFVSVTKPSASHQIFSHTINLDLTETETHVTITCIERSATVTNISYSTHIFRLSASSTYTPT